MEMESALNKKDVMIPKTVQKSCFPSLKSDRTCGLFVFSGKIEGIDKTPQTHSEDKNHEEKGLKSHFRFPIPFY